MAILLFHELGHILMALYFKWHIEKVKLYPFGALTLFEEHLNKPIKEEMMIVLAGPIFQLFFYHLFSGLNWNHFKEFHYCLLYFNLLPIIPLDGSKIVMLFYQYFFSYWRSFYFLFYISILTLPLLFFQFGFSLVLLLILITLFMDMVEFFQTRNFCFRKFLLERILYRFAFSKRKVIHDGNIKKMKRDTKHLFYQKGHFVSEETYLQKMFDFKGKAW
ncbi:MAG: hypothetical protein HFH08_02790 [Bacilli bacterium]|nr:hypothetical protein [Bacilli bacterium]